MLASALLHPMETSSFVKEVGEAPSFPHQATLSIPCSAVAMSASRSSSTFAAALTGPAGLTYHRRDHPNGEARIRISSLIQLFRRPRMLNAGDVAPDFTLNDHRGRTVKLSDLRGRRVVLWFYPKADTPG